MCLSCLLIISGCSKRTREKSISYDQYLTNVLLNEGIYDTNNGQGPGDSLTASSRNIPGVAGRIFANGDDSFILYLNNEKILDGHGIPGIAEVVIKAGDVLSAKCINTSGGTGFACVFISDDEKIKFSSSAGSWSEYTPRDPENFWIMDISQNMIPCGVGNNQDWKKRIEELTHVKCEALWGHEYSNAYLMKKVTINDLSIKQK